MIDSQKTDYTIIKCGEHRTVWLNSKSVAKGFYDDESALHAIWVIEGKKLGDFYILDGKDVLKKVKKIDAGQ